MNKITKLLSVFVIAGAIGAGVAGVAGCKKSNGHSHKYNYTVDVEDATKHNGVCDCGKNPILKQDHVDTKNNETGAAGADGVCDLCGAPVNPEQPGTDPTVTSVTVSAAGGATSVKAEETLQLSATVVGTNNPAQTVTWSSSDTSKATVNASTGLVTGVAEGQVTITATSTVDTSQKGTINLTVTAKGTVDPGPGPDDPDPVEKTVYETLMERNDKLTYIDSSYAEETKLENLKNYTTKGIWFRPQTGGSTAATDPERDYVEIIKDGTDLAFQQHGSDGSTTGLPNVYTDIVIGSVSGTVEGYFETKISKLASGTQDFINFTDGADSIFKVTLNGGVAKYKVGAGNETACDANATVAENTYVKVYFKLDKDNGKVTVKFDDTVILNEKAIDIGALNCIELASSNKGQRAHTTKKIVVCGTALTLDQYKVNSKTSLKATYDKYPLATEYTTNGAHVTKAYDDGVKAIDAAADMDGVSTAHAAAVAAMKAILKDSEIPAARSAAKTALETKFPYTNYNIALDAGLPNSKYNNKAKHAEEMKAYEDAILAATLQSELDEIVNNATITVGTDAEQRAEMKKEAIANLKAHLASKATEIADLDESDKLRIDAIITVDGETVTGSGITAINGADTIQNAQAAYDEAVADIDRIIENANKSIDEIIAAYEKDLDDFVPSRAYSDTDKIDLDGEQTVAQLIAAAKAAGKTEIAKAKDITTVDGVESPTAAQILDAQKKFALAEFDKAKAAINLIACKNFRLNNTNEAEVDGVGVREYVKRAKEKVSQDDVLALFNALSEAEIKAATTIDEVVLKTRAYKFDVDIILKKNDACYGEGETDKPSTYGLEKYFNVQFAASGLREEDKEALHAKLYTHYETIYAIAADDTEEAVVAKITKAAADGRAAIDSEISALKNGVFTVTVKFNGYSDETTKTVNVRYGDTLTKDSIYITGMTVTNLYGEDGNEITEGVKIYAATTVKVNVSDVNPAAASSVYVPVGSATAVTPVSGNKVLDDTLLTVTVPDGCNIYHAGYKWTDGSSTKTFGQVAIKNESGTEVKFDDALTLGNITTNTDNSSKPLTIYAKSAVSSLKVYLKLAGSNGTDNRSGNVYYKINGGTAVERAGIDSVLVISDIKAGDVVQVYIKNTNKSGGHMWVTKVEAEADFSQTPKLVTVQWQNEDGSVWKTTTHSYLETVTAPEGSPEVTSGAHTGWTYDGTPLTEEGIKLASSPTAYVMTPTVAAPDVTVHFTDGTTTFDEQYLSSATTNSLPQERNASATNMFLGWFVQTGDAPADSDAEFDIHNLTAGEYNVYAKYLASTITVTYSSGTVDNLFILDGKVVKVDKSAATLPADPESTDPDKPSFKGWFYTPEGGEETQFTADVLAGLTAGNYTVTAVFEEMKEVVYSVDAGTLIDTAGVIVLNGGYENKTGLKWSGTINGSERTFTNCKRASGTSGRSFAVTVKAGTKISVAFGGNLASADASSTLTLSKTSASGEKLATATGTNTGKTGANGLLEFTVTEDGTYYIVCDGSKPCVFAIILN